MAKDVDMDKTLMITQSLFHQKDVPIVLIAVERLPREAMVELEMHFNKDKNTYYEYQFLDKQLVLTCVRTNNEESKEPDLQYLKSFG